LTSVALAGALPDRTFAKPGLSGNNFVCMVAMKNTQKNIRSLPWIGCLLLSVSVAGCGEDTGKPEQATQVQPEISSPDIEVGRDVYQKWCVTCHLSGVGGSPRLDDRQAWEDRLAKGRAKLVESVVDGMPPGMPARGLCRTCSDEELAEAVDYMLSRIPEK